MKPPKKVVPKGHQVTLDSFFQKKMESGVKRKTTEEDDKVVVGEAQVQLEDANKRSKSDGPPASPGGTVLSDQQRALIKQKQTAARLKLISTTLPLISPASIGHTWFEELLDSEFRKPYFKSLSDFYVTSSATVFPKKDDIFSWTRYCDIRDVKVVILGQDPYHGQNQAHGLCFSVAKGVPSPPSLVNMYKELVQDPGVEEFKSVPRHGCLEGWARQGVLLLNAVLTVESGKANSHKDKGWENLTTSVIKWISSNLRDVVFLLWGSYAQKKADVVDKSRHVLLQTTHPSPLSAHRGFIGCRHFSQCNEILVARGKQPVRWHELP